MIESTLPELGNQLRLARKKKFPQDDQKAFALRIGVSRHTYQKMEKGSLSVSLKSYYSAAKVLQMDKIFFELFKMKGSLFDE